MVWLFLEVMCEEWRSDVMERKKDRCEANVCETETK